MATMRERLAAHSGNGECKVCGTDMCILTGLMEPRNFPVDRVIMPRDSGEIQGYTDAAYVTALPADFVNEQRMAFAGLNLSESEEWADRDELPPHVSVIDEAEFFQRYEGEF